MALNTIDHHMRDLQIQNYNMRGKLQTLERLYVQLLTQHLSLELKNNNLLLSRLSERNRLKKLKLYALNKELAKKHSYF